MAVKKPTQDHFQQLKAAIRSNDLQRFYIFHGEEIFLLRHYLNQIQIKTVDELTQAFNAHRFTQENFSVQTFADAVEALPMMAEKTFIHVDDVDLFKLNEAEREKMAQVLSDVPEYCCMVFSYEIVQWKPDKRYKALWEAVNKHATIVEFAKQSQRDLIPWIARHFAAHQKTISQKLCIYLIELTGGTMTALQGEIQKIIAYSGSSEICKADIDAVTEPVLDAVVFEMTQMLSDGEYDKALEKLQQLFKMQEEPIRILGAVGGHFRNISAARVVIDSGRNSDDLVRLRGIKDYPARKAMTAAGKLSQRFCQRAAELIMETDWRMKTSFDDPQRLLELLILQLAQEAKNG